MKRTIVTVVAAILCAGGCTSYYKVTDPHTNKTYYTTELRRNDGTSTLKDARTGNMVTIQNSEISQISKEQFESEKVREPKAAEAAPANPFK